MLVEARRAASNERAQLARGGIEPPDDVYRVMQFVYPAAFLAMFAEGFARGLAPTPLMIAGAAIFAAAKALKWWAILSLGPFWTFRVIVVPGAPRELPKPDAAGVRVGFTEPSDAPSGVIAIIGARIVTMKGDEVIADTKGLLCSPYEPADHFDGCQ